MSSDLVHAHKPASGSDEFQRKVKPFFEKLEGYSRPLIIGFGLFLAVGIGVVLWLDHSKQGEEQAQAALYQAQKVVETEVKAYFEKNLPPIPEHKADAKQPEQPDPKRIEQAQELEFRKLDVDGTFAKSVTALKETAEKHRGTHAAFEAKMLLATLYFQHQALDSAKKTFSEAVEWAPNDSERSQAQVGLSSTLESLGEYDPSLKALDEALRKAPEGLKGEILLAKARNLNASGKKEDAKAVYNQIEKDFANTAMAEQAKTLKSLLK